MKIRFWQSYRRRFKLQVFKSKGSVGRSLLLMLLSFAWTLGFPAQSLGAMVPLTESRPPERMPLEVMATPALGHPQTETLAVSLSQSLSKTDRSMPLLEGGKMEYQAGRLQAAVVQWQDAAKQAQQTHDLRGQAIAHNYLAIAYQDLENWAQAEANITLALAAVRQMGEPFLQAQLLNTQGSISLHQGQPQAALDAWEQAEALYRQVDALEPLVRSQLNQVQALRALGFYRRSQAQLEAINHTLKPLPDSALKLRALQSFGGLLRRLGNLEKSQAILKQGLAMAEQLNLSMETQAIRLNLARTLVRGANVPERQAKQIAQEHQQALRLVKQVRAEAHDRSTQLEAGLEQMAILMQQGQKKKAWAIAKILQQQLYELTASRWNIQAQIQFVNILIGANGAASDLTARQAIACMTLLQQAIGQSQQLQDQRAESQALGTLGHVYEQRGRRDDGLRLTHRALQLAQQIQAADLVAQWQWQRGRLLAQQQQNTAAQLAYSEAFETLEGLQQDLVAMGPEIQLSFRTQIEPAYRQYVKLLLDRVDDLPEAEKQRRLERARQILEALQLAELQNYFRQACLTYDTRDIETIDPDAAVFYPVLLDDRLDVVLALPNQPLRHYSSKLSQRQQSKLLRALYASLNGAYPAETFQRLSQQLYRYLIQPAHPMLRQQQMKTLVFVADGFLRNLPMAALYDGAHYLLEDYSVALSPGLQLLNAQALSGRSPTLLAAGLAEARQGFLPLPAVQKELDQIQAVTPGNRLFNQTFNQVNLTEQLSQQELQIVHLATHGKFSSRAEETYLVTWDEQITVKELDQIFQYRQGGGTSSRDPLDLLVLSACQTAVGDDRAALGMAGMAVRSGARSTLATLWSVNDESTAMLMSEFYQHLIDEGMSRGEALRQAQISLMQQPQYRRPYYWAPFVLVGNWL